MSRPYLTIEECVEKYPRLASCLMWVMIGSTSEAGCVIRDYRAGRKYSCEACSHAGQTTTDRIKHAVRSRHYVRKAYGTLDLVERRKRV